MSAYVKTPKHSLQNKLKIGNIDEKKYLKMEVSKFYILRRSISILCYLL